MKLLIFDLVETFKRRKLHVTGVLVFFECFWYYYVQCCSLRCFLFNVGLFMFVSIVTL